MNTLQTRNLYVNAVYDNTNALLLAAAGIFLPALWYMRRESQRPPFESPYRSCLTLLLASHTFYIVYTLLVLWPPNIFTSLNLSLNTPPEVMRTTLLRNNHLPLNFPLPPSLSHVLTRLSSFDMRILYVRFGHEVLQQCTECYDLEEYALFTLPLLLKEYLREVLVVGLLTVTGSLRERWRVLAIATLCASALAEAWFILTADVQMPNAATITAHAQMLVTTDQTFMWHDAIWLSRQYVFLFLPILVHFLPAQMPRPPTSMVVNAANTILGLTLNRLQTLRYTRAAIMRDRSLHAAASSYWGRQRTEGEWARADSAVRMMAEKLGQGFVEGDEHNDPGKLRLNARLTAKRMLEYMQPEPPQH